VSTPHAELAEIVAAVLEVDPAEISDPAGPATLPSWTSMRHIQLVVAVQEAYGLSFDYTEISGIRTVGDLRALVAARAGQGAAR
jgi:acyl carrier protein